MLPCSVAQNLHFDVFGAADVALQKHRVVAERRLRLAPRLFQPSSEVAGLLHHAHAAPAAAERRFDDQREADLLRELFRLFRTRDRRFRSGNHGDTGLAAPIAAPPSCRPEVRASRALGPMKVMPACSQARGSAGILGKKPIARMDGIHSLLARQRHDALHVEIRFHRSLAGSHFSKLRRP